MKNNSYNSSNIVTGTCYEAETLEVQVSKILTGNEPMPSLTAPIFTERKDGVQAEHNIRTDRFDVALKGTDYISKSNLAKREAKILEKFPPQTETQE